MSAQNVGVEIQSRSPEEVRNLFVSLGMDPPPVSIVEPRVDLQMSAVLGWGMTVVIEIDDVDGRFARARAIAQLTQPLTEKNGRKSFEIALPGGYRVRLLERVN